MATRILSPLHKIYNLIIILTIILAAVSFAVSARPMPQPPTAPPVPAWQPASLEQLLDANRDAGWLAYEQVLA